MIKISWNRSKQKRVTCRVKCGLSRKIQFTTIVANRSKNHTLSHCDQVKDQMNFKFISYVGARSKILDTKLHWNPSKHDWDIKFQVVDRRRRQNASTTGKVGVRPTWNRSPKDILPDGATKIYLWHSYEPFEVRHNKPERDQLLTQCVKCILLCLACHKEYSWLILAQLEILSFLPLAP